jgi:hypothetical protein
MQRLLAIAWLTWKAALRFRLFIVVAALLLLSVIGLPLLLKDDGTARGFTQILLTYTLSTITGLLGLSTLWLSCGTLARDIEDCQMQVVAVKPVARWQIWLGKWLGIMSLNAVLLALSGISVYGLLLWRANKLPPGEQAILRNEVLVARGSAKERSYDKEIQDETSRRLRERLEKNPVSTADFKEVEKQIREQVKADLQVVPPGYSRPWQIELGIAKNWLHARPLQVRLKFNAADRSTSGTFYGIVRVGVPQKTKLYQSDTLSLAPDTFHEIPIPPDLYDDQGILTVTFLNPNNTALLFTLDEGMEVLYPEGGFGLNFARGIGVIFCWMGLLAAIGLAAATFLSFPVAAFFAMGILVLVSSSNLLASTIEEGGLGNYNAEKGGHTNTPVDWLVIPVFKGALNLINLAKEFSPIDNLSTGRSIPWSQLGRAFAQVVLLLGGIFALGGVFIFSRRELATAQGTH